MEYWLDYLSGNVPGGFSLYLLILAVIVGVLVFMRRVNELFTAKHFIRWLLGSLFVVSIFYAALWFHNPPDVIYKSYTIGLLRSDTQDNWLGRFWTDRLSEAVLPYRGSREHFIPYHWFYRLSPVDSVQSPDFMERIYRQMPLEGVLEGDIQSSVAGFRAHLRFRKFPAGELVREAEKQFFPGGEKDFMEWTVEQFGDLIPFSPAAEAEFIRPDSILTHARHLFYLRQFAECRRLLRQVSAGKKEAELWDAYAAIKMAGEERSRSDSKNPYAGKLPDWQKQMHIARPMILEYLKTGKNDFRAQLLVAESYIWEEKYEQAEVFLKKMFSDNPSDIDVLLNLSFLHPSRYRELGFANVREIYRRILTLFPLDEPVLLKWSEYILLNHPAYTPPPEFARTFLERYLRLNPYSYKIWSMLGRIYAQQRLREKSRAAFLTADSLQPGRALTSYNLGVLYYEWDKWSEAEAYFKTAVQQENLLDAHLYLGAIYKKQGRYREALEEFRYRVKNKTGDEDTYAYQAMQGIRDCLEGLAEEGEQP